MAEHKNLIPWEPGQSGNPAGRPKGSRHKITEAFLRDFFEAWEAFGRPALVAAAWKDPVAFVKVAASLLPKEFRIEATVSDMTDEQLDARIRGIVDAFGEAIGLASAGEGGLGDAAGRTEAPARADQAPPVSTLQ